MYTLTWNINDKCYSVAGTYDSIFRVYLALRDSLRVSQYQRDTFIKCIDCNGVPIDLEKGRAEKASPGKEKILISKGTYFHQK